MKEIKNERGQSIDETKKARSQTELRPTTLRCMIVNDRLALFIRAGLSSC